MERKKVGVFTGDVGNPHPCFCEIADSGHDFNGCLRFSHQDLSDLEHLVKQMKKEAINFLPEKYKNEV